MPSHVRGRWVEVASVVLIAFAVMIGGRALLANLAHYPLAAFTVLCAVGVLLALDLRRSRREGAMPLRLTRNVAFLAATALALLYVAVPARWSGGAAVAAVELGLVTEFFALIVPDVSASA